jgi:hypothetical protein
LFYFVLVLVFGLLNGIFDGLVHMNVNDLLNPIEDPNGQGKPSNPSGDPSGDPNPKDDQKVPSILEDGSVNEYTTLADKLENTKKEVLEQRSIEGAASKSTTFSELGVRFQR